MASGFPAVEYGPLCYRKLEKDKTIALSKNKGNFQASMTISKEAMTELRWWLETLRGCFKNILTPSVDLVLYSDA